MRILSLYYMHKPGGFCKRLYRMLATLTARGHEVHFLALEKPEQLPTSIHFHQIPFFLRQRKGLFFWACFVLWCPMYAALQSYKIKPDRYVVFGAFYSAVLSISGILWPKPLVLFLRGLSHRVNEITQKPKIIRALNWYIESWGIRSASMVVCQTRAMQSEFEMLLGKPLSRVQILPNDVPAFSHQSPETKTETTATILTSGVIDAGKNLGLLISAMEQLAKLTPKIEVKLTILGEGPLRSVLTNEAKQRKLSRIEFVGWQAEPSRFLQNAALYIHPSLYEGMPNSVLEAMGHSVPVLLADTPELRELAGSRELTFDAQNPLELAHRIHEFFLNSAQREKITSLTLARAQELRFDWDARVCEIIEAS